MSDHPPWHVPKPRWHLETVHFCRENKVRYRMHLTVGMLLSGVAAFVATHYGINWLNYAAIGGNTITAMIWIWE